MLRFLYEYVRQLKIQNKNSWHIVYKVNKLIANIIFPLCQRLNRKVGVDINSNIIVSLTSFPDRIDKVWITIASLLNQTYKPKAIVLWLAEEQFIDHKLPKSLERLCGRGLEIRFCEDLKPHKKYYETMLSWPDYFVITADDDILYPEDLIENLITAHEKYRGCVVCNWSHTIEFNESGLIKPYNEWPNEGLNIPSYRLMPVGCNGVLYPPCCLDQEVFNKESIKNYTLFTDDLWLKCMEVKNKTKAVNYQEVPLIYFNNIWSQKKGLWKQNTTGSGNRNEQVWKELMSHYPEVEKRIREA